MTGPKAAPQIERMLNRKEAAAILGIAPGTLTMWARTGRIACARTLGGHSRFRESVVIGQAARRKLNLRSRMARPYHRP
jgi:excisionase family DNA binding protein